MLLCAWWPFFFYYHKRLLFKIYFKSLVYSKQNTVVLRFEIVSDIRLSVTPVFTALILLLFFKLSKYINVLVSFLLIFSFFLRPSMPLWLVEELFQTLEYFLHFSYFNRKIKTNSKTIANQNILFINVISSFNLFLKTLTCNVSSGVIFHIQIELKSFPISGEGMIL